MAKKSIAAAVAAALVAAAAAAGLITWEQAETALRWLGTLGGAAS